MDEKELEEQIEHAKFYDEMINWEQRLKREIPVIAAFFEKGTVLDIACSSGRHSFALNDYGFQTVGVDISQGMIGLALELKEQLGKSAEFHCMDVTDPAFVDAFMGTYFDNALLLGNAIANMGDRDRAIQMMRNVFTLLRPGGKFFVQTVHRPSNPHYSPLRKRGEDIVQRIMVPVRNKSHNVELHVNIINFEPAYVKQVSDNQFYMYTLSEFKELVESTGFEIKGVYSGYDKQVPRETDAETLIWEIKKPEIVIYPETERLFEKYCGINREEIEKRVLKVWQPLIRLGWYHCIRGYRFIYPRITSHPLYREIVEEFVEGRVLDRACNTGTDLRQLVVDGFNPEKLVGVDIVGDYFTLGFELFGDKSTCRIQFEEVDVVANNFLNIDNTGRVSGKFARFVDAFEVVHAGSLLHLLDQKQNEKLIQHVSKLVKKSGVFFGRTVGATTPGYHLQGLRYLHSSETLYNLLTENGFSEVKIIEMPKTAPVGERSTDKIIQFAFFGRKT